MIKPLDTVSYLKKKSKLRKIIFQNKTYQNNFIQIEGKQKSDRILTDENCLLPLKNNERYKTNSYLISNKQDTPVSPTRNILQEEDLIRKIKYMKSAK